MIYPSYGEEGNVEFSDMCLESPRVSRQQFIPIFWLFKLRAAATQPLEFTSTYTDEMLLSHLTSETPPGST